MHGRGGIRRKIKRGKKKSYTISDITTFMNILNDIFDKDQKEDDEMAQEEGEEVEELAETNDTTGDEDQPCPIDEMITELKEIKDLNNALAQFSLALYDRVVMGCCGNLVGIPRENTPVQYSILAAPDNQVEGFCYAFQKLAAQYQTLKNQSDVAFYKMLSQLLTLRDELQDRLTLVIGYFIKHKIYARSKKDDFFMAALTKENNSAQILAKVVLGLEKVLGVEETFKFCKENGFITAMKHPDFAMDEFLAKCQDFSKCLHSEEKQLLVQQQKTELLKAFKEQPSNVSNLISQAKGLIYEDDKQWLQFLIDNAMQAIDLRESDLERAIQPFKLIQEEIKAQLKSVEAQGQFMDYLQYASYSQNYIGFFRQILFFMHKEQLIDGNVIIAWYDRAQGRGKVTLAAQVQRFINWLKAE